MFQYFNQLGGGPTRQAATVVAYGDAYNATGTGIQPAGEGSASFVLNGPNLSNGMIKITIPQNIISTGNFTFEFWAYPNYSIGSGFTRRWVTWGTSSNSSRVDFRTTNSNPPTSMQFYRNNTILDSADVIQNTAWQHIALVRISGGSKVYVNGSRTFGAFADSFDYSTYDTICLGGFGSSTIGLGEFFGNMDEFRLSNIARYSSNFTPPSTKFSNDANTVALIHCEDAQFSNSQIFEDDVY